MYTNISECPKYSESSQRYDWNIKLPELGMRLLSNPNKYAYWLLFPSTEYLKICVVGTYLVCQMHFCTCFTYFTANLSIPTYFCSDIIVSYTKNYKNKWGSWKYLPKVMNSDWTRLLVPGSQFHLMRSLLEHILGCNWDILYMIWTKSVCPVIGYPAKILNMFRIKTEPTCSTKCIDIR